MTKYFDGKKYAEVKYKNLSEKIRKMGITPKLVSIIVGDDQASILYQNLKKKAAEKVGAELQITSLSSSLCLEDIQKEIHRLNEDSSVHGIMIQLPLPSNFSKEDREELINSIDKQKDVDGLREDGPFVAPVVKAVFDNLPSKSKNLNVAVVGAAGFEGSKTIKYLRKSGYSNVTAIGRSNDTLKKIKDADVIISAVGQPGLIDSNMIKDGVTLIDLGSPYGDIEKNCYQKASYVTPVPGGIGPATIANLIKNLAVAARC